MINAFKISKKQYIYIYILSGLCTVFVCLSWSLSWFSLFLDKFSLSFLVYHFFIIIDGVVSTVHFRDWFGCAFKFCASFCSWSVHVCVCFGCSVRVLVYRRDTNCKAVT